MDFKFLISKKKGCDYCLKFKSISTQFVNFGFEHNISNETNTIKSYDKNGKCVDIVNINYCPICGKKL